MSFLEFMIAPLIIFLVFIAPLWLILHYRTLRREADALSAGEHENLERMVALLERMEARIGALEKILDAEHPGLRVKD